MATRKTGRMRANKLLVSVSKLAISFKPGRASLMRKGQTNWGQLAPTSLLKEQINWLWYYTWKQIRGVHTQTNNCPLTHTHTPYLRVVRTPISPNCCNESSSTWMFSVSDRICRICNVTGKHPVYHTGPKRTEGERERESNKINKTVITKSWRHSISTPPPPSSGTFQTACLETVECYMTWSNNNTNESLLYSAILVWKLLDSPRYSTTRNHSTYLAPWMTPPHTPSHTYTPVTIVPVQNAPYFPHYPVMAMQSVELPPSLLSKTQQQQFTADLSTLKKPNQYSNGLFWVFRTWK